MWHTINNVIKKTNNKSSIIDSLKSDNITYTNAIDISNAFGKYFFTIGETIAAKGGNSNIPISSYLNKIPRQGKSVFLTPCTKTEIKKLITNLLSKNSSGYDDISNIILKEIGDTLLEPLTLIFNRSLKAGVFPSDMEIADISPLFKSGSKHLLNNYQPISLLLTISKLLEKIIHTRIYCFLDNNDSFFKSQYSFRKCHSCEHAVTELLGEICKGLENGQHTLALLLIYPKHLTQSIIKFCTKN